MIGIAVEKNIAAAQPHAVDIEATVRVSGGELRVRHCRLRSLSLGAALIEFDRMAPGSLVMVGAFGLLAPLVRRER